jgi:hypothetical protein
VEIRGNRGNRANADKTGVSLNKADEKRVVAHEVAHVLEMNNPSVYQAAVAFRERRTQGEKTQSLRSATGVANYGAGERTRADKFLHPYMGKEYPSYMGATEIISMGLEYMYAEPVRFARDDPDYFDFIYTLMRK